MILYRLFTFCMHLNKDSSGYFTYMGGRKSEGEKQTKQNKKKLVRRKKVSKM